MKIIPYDFEHKASILAEALVTLFSGGTVVYPTETAYGLGADFFSPSAYRKVYQIKYRDARKPMPVIVPDAHYARTLVQFPPLASQIAEQYWPGPLTLVLPFLYSKEWPHHGNDYLGLRVSSHPLAASLARAFGRPLISTSANMSGMEPAYTIDEVTKQLEGRRALPDLVIDAGKLPRVEPSTIVKIDDAGMKILRQGGLHINEI